MSQILSVKQLSVVYSSSVKVTALDQINFEINQPVLLAIIGPNGGGKSTLLKSILGLVPYSGNIEIQGHPTNSNNIFQKLNIGYVPQQQSIDWNFPIKVIDLVMMGSYRKLGWWRQVGTPEREQATEVLNQVNMTQFKDRPIAELSGGQKQRVIVARTLMQNCDIYFLDEPFQGIDIQSENTLIDLLINLRKKRKSLIVVNHNLTQVKKHFETCLLINKKIIGYGTPQKILKQKNIELAYLS